MKWYQYEKVELSLSTRYGIYLIVYVIICLFIFSTINAQKVSQTVRDTIEASIQLQTENIDKIMDQQLDKLETLCDYISKQDSLINDSILDIAASMAEKTNLSHIFVSDMEGNAYFNNQKIYDISDESYFLKPIQGEIVVAESAQSVVDGEFRVVMSLPVYKDNKIVGIVGGSYDLFSLDRLVFINRLTNKESISFIMKKDGDLVSINEQDKVTISTNFYEYFNEIEFKDVTIDDLKDKLNVNEAASCIVKIDGQDHYMSLDVLDINEWVLGYITPVTVAHMQYEFVYLNEIALFALIGVGFIVFLLFVLRDFRREQRLLIQQATLDSLTSLLNKKSTEQQIIKSIDHCSMSAMIIIDVDNFKNINDQYGHDVGDQYLIKISECLRELFRKNDIVGRIGGDEMMAFMTNISSSEDACAKVEKFLKKVGELSIDREGKVRASCSVGIAFYPQDGETFETLYKKADTALYQAKNKGKSGYCVYEEDK